MSSSYILYSSEGCHLCEDALALCTPIINNNAFVVKDIVEDEALVEQYGMHIPVLMQVESNEKLFWPFTSENITEFIQ